jgi:siroheme synthase-like protein
MGVYPIVIELEARPCVVIGGGAVAERKVEGLLDVRAQVTVVSPRLSPQLDAWARVGAICHVARAYRPGDLAGFALAFVATDDGAVNAAVAAEGRRDGVWVNAADDPVHCDFLLPAVLRRGDLLVAVSTGGGSPALSSRVRDEIAAVLTEDYAGLAAVATEVRRELRAQGRVADGARWRAALDPDLRHLIAAGRRDEAKARLLAALGA